MCTSYGSFSYIGAQIMIITYSGPNCSKLNKVVSKHNVKTSVLKYGKYIDILAEKM